MVLEPSSSRDQEGSPDCPVQAVTRQLHLPAGCCQQVLPCQTILGFPITFTMSMETTPVPWAPPQQKDMTFTTARGDEPPPLQGQVPPAPSQGGVSRGLMWSSYQESWGRLALPSTSGGWVGGPDLDPHLLPPGWVGIKRETKHFTTQSFVEHNTPDIQVSLKSLIFPRIRKMSTQGEKNHHHNLRSEVRRLWQEFSSSYNTKQYCTRQLQAWLK